MADGIVEFARHKHSTRDERFLRVSKLRGSGYREGLHGFQITSAGLEVYPRLVSPPTPAGILRGLERVPTGVAGLDRLLGDGLWRGSTSLLAGPTGSGKTTIGLQFALAGLTMGEPALYVNFQENPTQLARAIADLGGDVSELQRQGLHLLYTSSVELQIDHLIVQMFAIIEQHGIRRVVLDAIGDLSLASVDVHRTHDYLYALVQRFAVAGITALLLLEDVTRGPMAGGSPVASEFATVELHVRQPPPARDQSRREAEPAAQHLQDPGERPRRGRAPDHDHRARGPCRVTCSPPPRPRPRVSRGRRGRASPADGAEPRRRAGGIARRTSWISPRGRPPACSARSRRS